MEAIEILEKVAVLLLGGIGGVLLFWRRIMTKDEHDQSCGIGDVMGQLDEAITKDELDDALKATAKETDLKLEALKKSVSNVEGKVEAVKESLAQTRKDLSDKLSMVVSLLTGQGVN